MLNLRKCSASFGAPEMDNGEQATAVGAVAPSDFGKVLSAYRLLDAIRTYGHLAADIYPLNDRPKDSTRLELAYYGLTESDLQAMPASLFFKNVPVGVDNGLSAVNYLKSLYTGKIAYEFAHVIDEEERNWIQSKIENGKVSAKLSTDDKKDFLKDLQKSKDLKNIFTVHLSVRNDFQLKDLIHLLSSLDELSSSFGRR